MLARATPAELAQTLLPLLKCIFWCFESTQMLKRVSIALLSGPSKPSVVASSAYSQFD
jgi:hypothetical protein